MPSAGKKEWPGLERNEDGYREEEDEDEAEGGGGSIAHDELWP